MQGKETPCKHPVPERKEVEKLCEGKWIESRRLHGCQNNQQRLDWTLLVWN